MATATGMTADEFAMIPHQGFELVDGEMVELPMSVSASWTAFQINLLLGNHARQTKCGAVFGADTGIRCYRDDPDRVRKPDGLFIKAERLKPEALSAAFLPVVPDLVIEVVSPTDLAQEVNHKIREYLAAGVQMVWVIYPLDREAFVYRADGTVTAIQESGVLEGANVVPGFRCVLSEVLPPIPLS